MNDDLVLRIGEAAYSILRASPNFDLLIQAYEQQVATDILSTKPNDRQRREHLYDQLQGSRAFLDFIKEFADGYARLVNTDAEAADAQEDIDDPGVHDIYSDNTN